MSLQQPKKNCERHKVICLYDSSKVTQAEHTAKEAEEVGLSPSEELPGQQRISITRRSREEVKEKMG
jgi:hypothetical protein